MKQTRKKENIFKKMRNYFANAAKKLFLRLSKRAKPK